MPLWIPIAFTAVVLWVTENLIDKYLLEKYRHDGDSDTDANTLFMFSALFALPTALFALIMGVHFNITFIEASAAVIAGLLNGIYLLLYLYAIAKTELSRTIPFFQSIPFFTAFFGWILLRETLTHTQLIAGLFITAGAFMLSYHVQNKSFRFRPTMLILGASAAIALQFTLFKYTALNTSYWTSVFWSSLGLICMGLFVYGISKRSRIHIQHIFIKKEYRIIVINLLNEFVDNLAMFTFLFATLLGPIALVQTVNAYQPILLLCATFLLTKFGYDFLKEDTSSTTFAQKALGILLIGIGSAFIYVPLIRV